MKQYFYTVIVNEPIKATHFTKAKNVDDEVSEKSEVTNLQGNTYVHRSADQHTQARVVKVNKEQKNKK